MRFCNSPKLLALWGLLIVVGHSHQIFGETRQALPNRLSAVEADAIVEEAAKNKEFLAAERLERLTNDMNFKVLQTREVDLGNRKVTMNRVSPPVRMQFPEAGTNVTVSTILSESQILDLRQRSKKKALRSLILFAKVYDRSFTELRWNYAGEQFVAYSSIDFNFMRSVTELETDDANYLFFLVIGNKSTNNPNVRNLQLIPQPPQFKPGHAEYVVVSDDNNIIERDEVFDPIDTLHVFYQQNEERLKVESQSLEALIDAHKRYNAERPKQEKDTVINFWPVRGSTNE